MNTKKIKSKPHRSKNSSHTDSSDTRLSLGRYSYGFCCGEFVGKCYRRFCERFEGDING